MPKKTNPKDMKVSKKPPVLRGEEDIIMTKEGLKALHEELEFLQGPRRKQIAARLKEAISYGDLSENSEYEEAKNEQAFTEGRIMELEGMIKVAKVVDDKQHSKQVVEIGSKVKIRHVRNKEDMDIALVGATEADPFSGKISNESPLGMALLGAKVGEIVTVHTPTIKTDYEVLKLS